MIWTKFIIEYHYKMANFDKSFFVKANASSLMILVVYVDDVILAGNDLNVNLSSWYWITHS